MAVVENFSPAGEELGWEPEGEGGWVAFSISWQAAETEGPFRGFPAASSSLGTGELEKVGEVGTELGWQ